MTEIRYVLLLLCLVLAAGIVACDRDNITLATSVEGVQVTGTGSVSGDPDVAVLDLGVVAEESNVDEARESAAYAMERVLDSLKINGVAEKDIQTRQFSIRPVYNYSDGQRVLRGYEVSNTVSAKVRDIDNTGKIIDDAVTAGGKWINVNSINFAIDDPKALQEQARAEAMADAKAKAQSLADLGGVVLGKPVSISESIGGSPIYRYDMGASNVGSATPIEPGELEISVTVVVIYNIEE